MISRRRFLEASSLAAALGPLARAKKLQTVGVELYTVRALMPEKPVETLHAIEAIGYREAEGAYDGLDKLAPELRAARLQPVAVHIDLKIGMEGSDDQIARMADDIKRNRVSYAVFPYVPPADRGGLDKTRAFAERLNKIGGKCHAAGLGFCYHNHCFEFEPIEGTTRFQVMMDNTDRKLVGLEMDVFWVSVGGHDPAELLQKLAGRVPLVHLKDKAAGTPVVYQEQSAPRTSFKEVGHGVLDWPKILRAANAAGVKHYFVEQDQTPGDPVASLRQSFEYLHALDF